MGAGCDQRHSVRRDQVHPHLGGRPCCYVVSQDGEVMNFANRSYNLANLSYKSAKATNLLGTGGPTYK